MQRKRPCAVCRRWFLPDLRVGDRQKVCGDRKCKVEQRRLLQADWRRRNPDYQVARRLHERASERPLGDASEPYREPAPRGPLTRLPWDVAKDEFGAKGTEFIRVFGGVIVRHCKDELATQIIGITGEFQKQRTVDTKDKMQSTA
jgi:hypothetical protein